jgi:hypothetical protein
MRRFGAGLAASGLLIGLIWGVTAGSRPEAVLGGFDVPVAGLLAVIVGFLVWMVGMAKAERAEEAAWAKLGGGYSALPRSRPVTAAARRSAPWTHGEEIRVYRTPRVVTGRVGAALADPPSTAEFAAV